MHQNGNGEELAIINTGTQGNLDQIVDLDLLQNIGRQLLVALGEEPDRPGLKDTPRRWANMWKEFVEYNPGKTETLFEQGTFDQMVVVSGIRVWSICEHHLLPFWCDIHIGYIPEGKVLGLSKFARIAHMYAHRLQLQEQLVRQIAEHVEAVTESPHVAVYGSGEHLCMTMRGIRSEALMQSSVMNGRFDADPHIRSEFHTMIRNGSQR